MFFIQNTDNIIAVIFGILDGLIPIVIFINFDSLTNIKLAIELGIYDLFNSYMTIGKKDKIKELYLRR
jgi:hypothetical protein